MTGNPRERGHREWWKRVWRVRVEAIQSGVRNGDIALQFIGICNVLGCELTHVNCSGRRFRSRKCNGKRFGSVQVENDDAPLWTIGEGKRLEVVRLLDLDIVIITMLLIPGWISSSERSGDHCWEDCSIGQRFREELRSAQVGRSTHVDNGPKERSRFVSLIGGVLEIIDISR